MVHWYLAFLGMASSSLALNRLLCACLALPFLATAANCRLQQNICSECCLSHPNITILHRCHYGEAKTMWSGQSLISRILIWAAPLVNIDSVIPRNVESCGQCGFLATEQARKPVPVAVSTYFVHFGFQACPFPPNLCPSLGRLHLHDLRTTGRIGLRVAMS